MDVESVNGDFLDTSSYVWTIEILALATQVKRAQVDFVWNGQDEVPYKSILTG